MIDIDFNLVSRTTQIIFPFLKRLDYGYEFFVIDTIIEFWSIEFL